MQRLSPIALPTALLSLALVSGSVWASHLESRLERQLPEVMARLQAKYQNVGILRFRTQDGDAAERFDTPLSGRLAERLETLLILHNAPEESKALGILHDASKAASDFHIGSWYTMPSERRKLFRHSYRLAWGSAAVRPDAFLTGKVVLDRDRRMTTLTLECFERGDPARLVPLATIRVATDRNILRDLGHDLALSPESRTKLQGLERASADAEDRQLLAQPWVGVVPTNLAGVRFTVLVDGKPVRPRREEGGPWQIESPRPGSNLALELANLSDRKLGVVLRINGVSTLGEATEEPELAPKWVLAPGATRLLEGFHAVSGSRSERNETSLLKPFRILVGEHARRVTAQLGEKAGLLEVTVFEQGPARVSGEGLASPRGLPPSKEKQARSSYLGVRSALLASNQLKSTVVAVKTETPGAVKREVIVPDEDAIRLAAKVRLEAFPNPRMLAHLVLRIVPPR